MKKIFLLKVFIVIGSIGFAQNVTLKSVGFEGGKIALVYTAQDLGKNGVSGELFTSADNFSKAVTQVNGNIGDNILEGDNKLLWDYRKEGVTLPEDIEFEVRIVKLKPKYSSIFAHNLQLFWVPTEFSKKHSNQIVWRTHDLSKELIVELYKDENKLMILDFIKNTNSYSWLPPVDEGYYQFKLINKSDENDFIVSNLFKVEKGKVDIVDFDYAHLFFVSPILYAEEENIIDWKNAIYADEYKVSLYIESSFDRFLDIVKSTNISWEIAENMKKQIVQIKVEDTSNPSNYIISNYVNIMDQKFKERGEKIVEKNNSSTKIKVDKDYKRGEQLSVDFFKQLESKKILVELYKDGKKVKTIDLVENKGFYNWTIPSKEKKGYHYQMKIISNENSSNFIFTTDFKIE